MLFIPIHPRATLAHMGRIPDMLSDFDPRPAKEQLDAGYQHGGGWRSLPKVKLLPDGRLKFPGDRPFRPIAEIRLREERIVLYEAGLVAVVQSDGSFEISRMD